MFTALVVSAAADDNVGDDNSNNTYKTEIAIQTISLNL
jgi:hypothetical protein